MHPKWKELLAKLVDLLKPDPASRDQKAITECLDQMTAFAKSDEAKGYAPTEKFDEFVAQLDQLRKDLDAQTEEMRQLKRVGLERRGNRIEVLGYSEIMDLRRVHKVFRYRERAEQFGAMAAKAIYGRNPMYDELVSERARSIADEVTKQLDPAGAGSQLIANLYMADLIAHVEAVGVLFTRCDRVPLQTIGSTTWPTLTGELTAYPTAASAQFTESAPTYGTVPLTPIKWGVLTPVPNEFFRNPTLLDALGQRLAWLITRAIAYAFDNALVNGDGTADYGTITGLLRDGTLSAVTASAATSIAAYTGAEVGDVIAGMAKDYVEEPYWMFSLSAERTLRNKRSTVGTPLYERGSNGEPNTIDNYPYAICQRFPAAGSVGASTEWGAFGDMRLSHMFGMLGNIEIAQSEHVRFENDMTVLRGLAYADAAVKDVSAVIKAKTHA